MTERPDQVISAVATTNGFAISIRFAQTTTSEVRIREKNPYQEFIWWWWQQCIRVLMEPIFVV